MIACWFLVTWHDGCMYTCACVALLFVQNAHKTRLAVIALYVVDVKWLINSDRT